MKNLIHGALPDHEIGQLISTGTLLCADSTRIQPASIDLVPDLNTLMKLDNFTIPKKGECIEHLIMSMRKDGIANDVSSLWLDAKQHYFVRMEERFTDLPYFARANPKSSIGRIFTHSRLLCDGTNVIDEVPRGYKDGMWMLLTPKFFPVVLSEKESINQLRFFNGDARLTEHELRRELYNNQKLVTVSGGLPNKFPIEVIGNTVGEIPISVDLEGKCYRTKRTNRPLGLNERAVSFDEYYERIDPESLRNGLVIEEGRGYLIGTAEQFEIPQNMAVEVVVSDKYGEIKLHFAGFVDPGFGLGVGNSITLEIVSYERGLRLRHGQYVGTTRFEWMTSAPKKVYQGNYIHQEAGAKLPKYLT